MTALCLLALGLAAGYLGVIAAAFAALMRLPLRLVAERSGRSARLGVYLDDPVLLFLPARALLGVVHVLLALCLVAAVGLDAPDKVAIVLLSAVGIVLVFEHAIPYVIVRRDPERALEVLLPSFDIIVRVLTPLLAPLRPLLDRPHDRTAAADDAPAGETPQESSGAYREAGAPDGLIEGDGRKLLQSIVEFGGTLVREVMTPRPDIVAIRANATLAELRAFFREQEYSRIPVFTDSLDNIIGFVFIKDLMRLPADQAGDTAVSTLVRPAHVVPETKRVSDLLREFQRQQLQIAIVVDEYGGTAGLVTLEDLLEEIVGEIRDEYDIETEPVVVEPDGAFLVTGKADVHTVAERLGLAIEPEGFETFAGYILARVGRVPATGERFEVDGLDVEVLDAERRRVHRMRVRIPGGEAAARAAEPAGEPGA